MSIRAKRVNEIKHEQKTTVGIMSEEFRKFIEEWTDSDGAFYDTDKFYEATGNGGLFEVPLQLLKDYVQHLCDKNLNELEEQIQDISKDIKHAKENGNDFVMYYCF